MEEEKSDLMSTFEMTESLLEDPDTYSSSNEDWLNCFVRISKLFNVGCQKSVDVDREID